MNLFEFQDYRQALNEWVRHRKHWSKSISWMKIAAQVRIERTYLSKVIRQKAHLSSDQLFSICEALGIEPEQRSYLELLLEYERSNVKKRKEQFFEKIKELQKKNSMLENKVQAKVIRNQESPDLLFYYLDPNVQIIHQALQLKSLAQNLEQLKNALGISSDRFNEILEQLEKSKII